MNEIQRPPLGWRVKVPCLPIAVPGHNRRRRGLCRWLNARGPISREGRRTRVRHGSGVPHARLLTQTSGALRQPQLELLIQPLDPPLRIRLPQICGATATFMSEGAFVLHSQRSTLPGNQLVTMGCLPQVGLSGSRPDRQVQMVMGHLKAFTVKSVARSMVALLSEHYIKGK